MDPRTDTELMRGWLGRDEDAFDALVHRYGKPIKGYALRMLGSAPAAEDVFAETFVRLARQTEQTWQTGSVRGWLFTVAHRLCVDELRRRKRMVENAPGVRILEQSRAWTPNPEAQVLLGDRFRQLESALGALEDRHREVLLLRLVHHLTPARWRAYWAVHRPRWTAAWPTHAES